MCTLEFPEGNRFVIHTFDQITASDMLEILNRDHGVVTSDMLLSFKGAALHSDEPLRQYSIGAGETLYAFKRPRSLFCIQSDKLLTTPVLIYVKKSDNTTVCVKIALNDTVYSLCDIVFPEEKKQLWFNGKILNDASTLVECGINEGSVLSSCRQW